MEPALALALALALAVSESKFDIDDGYYRIEGVMEGVTVEVKIAADGTLLKMEREDREEGESGGLSVARFMNRKWTLTMMAWVTRKRWMTAATRMIQIQTTMDFLTVWKEGRRESQESSLAARYSTPIRCREWGGNRGCCRHGRGGILSN